MADMIERRDLYKLVRSDMIERLEKIIDALNDMRSKIVFANIDQPELCEWKLKKLNDAIRMIKELEITIKL